MRVTSLHRYPLKSGAPEDLEVAEIEPAGIVGDRRWMVIDSAGEKVSARTDRALLRVRCALDAGGAVFAAPGCPTLRVSEPVGPTRGVTVWGEAASARDAGDQAAHWFADLLRREDVRLVHCHEPRDRVLDPEYTRPGDHTGYADGFPVLITTQASLAQVNAWIEAETPGCAVPMRRFRPNIVLDGDAPFAEERWRTLRIGEVEVDLVKPCGRCVLTTIDPATLAVGKQPLRALARHHRTGSRTNFGMNAVPRVPGDLVRLALGDVAVPGG
ncbi:MOSC domain-containing protein [Serinibacter salmoneus]|uniref:MOSC domain-containing protein n=1 Tax=Serinibacter salmoneus TaxID=556530 RepID=UPI0014765327|nr:MOSC N-terminal beta barrel domain-containing protein [Serinibacter salmoneus]